MIEQLLEQRPGVVYGTLLVLIPLVVVFGMSLAVMLSALVVPLLIPLVALAGVRLFPCLGPEFSESCSILV
jgi:hypothetical protein